MIRKLKRKFILLAMTAVFCLLAVIVTGMNVINYTSVVQEADDVLTVLSKNKGVFPDKFLSGRPNDRPPNFSPETPYELRYFSVMMNASGDIVGTDMSKIASVDVQTATLYVRRIMESRNERGFVEDYRFLVYDELNSTRILFLDCGRKLDAFADFLYTSIGMACAGFVVVFLVVFVLSGKILKPMIESYEKQKRFITDAGHEIKTPLTIINANADILEMELGSGNESVRDIKQQMARLRTLTDDLVMLTRMEEEENTLQKIEFPLSDVVSEAAQSFVGLAAGQGKLLRCDIQPLVSFNGNDRAIAQLVYILLDNAVKYAANGSAVLLTLERKGKTIRLSVVNAVSTAVDAAQLKYVFDRFYRADASRNSETGGHGIGLSVAKAIVAAHGGKIQASTAQGRTFQMDVTFFA